MVKSTGIFRRPRMILEGFKCNNIMIHPPLYRKICLRVICRRKVGADLRSREKALQDHKPSSVSSF